MVRRRSEGGTSHGGRKLSHQTPPLFPLFPFVMRIKRKRKRRGQPKFFRPDRRKPPAGYQIADSKTYGLQYLAEVHPGKRTSFEWPSPFEEQTEDRERREANQ
jgi:hypothetical protein